MSDIPHPDLSGSSLRQGRFISIGEAGNNLAQTGPTVVRAEAVTISGTQSAPSQNIWIIADRVIATNDATLDVSGVTGAPSYASGVRASDGQGDGAAGQNADDSSRSKAGRGGDAGNITIVCRILQGALRVRANGGRGGDGLNGGNGEKGAKGAPGADNVLSANEARGGNGAAGGAAGIGGTAGSGGNAGQVYLAIQHYEVRPVVESAGGSPGNPGAAGTVGAGGDGGPGGAWGHHEEAPHPVGHEPPR